MTSPLYGNIKAANEISLGIRKDKELKQKRDLKNSDLKLKKSQLLASVPSSEEIAGDNLLAGAERMSRGPQNAATGLLEGLMRAFGGNLKGKASEEKKKQLMDALDVLDYAMQGEEYLQNTQAQIAKQREAQKYAPSQNQYEQSYSDGTLKATLTPLFQQLGVDPNRVSLSDDGLNVFMERDDGTILKRPVSDFFSPEDSKEFQFLNTMQKTNLLRTENKQVQGLAQENTQLKSRLQQLEEQFASMEGINPATARLLAEDTIRGEERLAHQLNNETRKADASVRKAELDAHYRPMELEQRKRAIDVSEINANSKLEALGLKNVKEILPRLEASASTVKYADDLLNDVKKHRELFGSALSTWIDTKGDSGAFSLKMQQLYGGKDRDAAMRIAKNISSLMLADAKSLGGQNNMTLDSWIQQSFPNIQYSPDNFKYIVEQIKNKAEFYRDIYRDTLNQSSNAHIGQSYDTRLGEFNLKSQQSRNSLDLLEGNIYVQDPKTGKTALLSPQDAKKAISRGGIIVK